MDKCAFCGAETQLYQHDIPICLKCDRSQHLEKGQLLSDTLAKQPAPYSTRPTGAQAGTVK